MVGRGDGEGRQGWDLATASVQVCGISGGGVALMIGGLPPAWRPLA